MDYLAPDSVCSLQGPHNFSDYVDPRLFAIGIFWSPSPTSSVSLKTPYLQISISQGKGCARD